MPSRPTSRTKSGSTWFIGARRTPVAKAGTGPVQRNSLANCPTAIRFEEDLLLPLCCR